MASERFFGKLVADSIGFLAIVNQDSIRDELLQIASGCDIRVCRCQSPFHQVDGELSAGEFISTRFCQKLMDALNGKPHGTIPRFHFSLLSNDGYGP